MSSLLRIEVVMLKTAESVDEVEGCDAAAMWISVSAATVLATT
jgi:hypothetical protein